MIEDTSSKPIDQVKVQKIVDRLLDRRNGGSSLPMELSITTTGDLVWSRACSLTFPGEPRALKFLTRKFRGEDCILTEGNGSFEFSWYESHFPASGHFSQLDELMQLLSTEKRVGKRLRAVMKIMRPEALGGDQDPLQIETAGFEDSSFIDWEAVSEIFSETGEEPDKIPIINFKEDRFLLLERWVESHGERYGSESSPYSNKAIGGGMSMGGGMYPDPYTPFQIEINKKYSVEGWVSEFGVLCEDELTAVGREYVDRILPDCKPNDMTKENNRESWQEPTKTEAAGAPTQERNDWYWFLKNVFSLLLWMGITFLITYSLFNFSLGIALIISLLFGWWKGWRSG